MSIIQTKDVKKWFGDFQALKGISMDVEEGEVLVICGPSGSGKSTMVNLIPRFYEILEGRIEIDGSNVKEIKLDNLRSLISTVSQNTVLFNDSIKNNISYAKPMASDEEIFEAARNANAHEFIESLPNGYETVVGDDGTLLSGGQKQRIAIARALLKKSKILLLGLVITPYLNASYKWSSAFVFTSSGFFLSSGSAGN